MKSEESFAQASPIQRNADLSAHAAAIDAAADAADTAGTIDTALGSVESEAKPGRGRPPGKKKKTDKRRRHDRPASSAPATTAAADDDDEELESDFFLGVITGFAQTAVEVSKKKGWRSPANPLQSEQEWCSAVGEYGDKVLDKYLGKKKNKIGPEFMLGITIAPWLIMNLWDTGVKWYEGRRKGNRPVGLDGIRKDAEAVGTDRKPAAGDPGGSHEGRQEFPDLGNNGTHAS